MSAPVSTSRVTVSVLPDRAASISGVAPVVVARFGIGAGGDQRRHDLGVPALAGHVQRRNAAQPRRRANVRAGRQQHLRQRRIAACAAQCSAVMPSPCAALTSAPCFSSAFTAAASRAFAASATDEPSARAERLATDDCNSQQQRLKPSLSERAEIALTTAPR